MVKINMVVALVAGALGGGPAGGMSVITAWDVFSSGLGGSFRRPNLA
jgi:predicted histidine transporter YuiF (NhaC family)